MNAPDLWECHEAGIKALGHKLNNAAARQLLEYADAFTRAAIQAELYPNEAKAPGAVYQDVRDVHAIFAEGGAK